MSDYKITAGLDIGNGYVKGMVQTGNEKPVAVDMPSTVSYVSASEPALPMEPTDQLMGRIGNILDLDISSRSIPAMDAGRILVGTRAIRSGGSQMEFNIDDHVVKSEDTLSVQLVLAAITGAWLQQVWQKDHKLPTDMSTLEVTLATALPIEDYLDWKDRYAARLMKNEHTVSVRNFETDILVRIKFVHMDVMAEGASAQFAIGDLARRTDGKFLDEALKIARNSGMKIDDAYTGKALMAAENTIGIDIGEGTVNFPVFTDGQVSIDASSSINKGYGTVLSAVVSELRNTSIAYESRKDLADFMLKDPAHLLPTQRRIQEKTQKYLDDQVRIFVKDLMKEYKSIFRRVGRRTDVIYVYGGGAGPVREALYPQLVDVSRIDEDTYIPVIWLDPMYSRNLNRNGLFAMAQARREQLDKKKAS